MTKKVKKEKDFYELLSDEFLSFYTDIEDDPNKIVGVIPTGSVSLDVSVGVGGIPYGRLTEIYGKEGVGKTTLALSICKNALLAGDNVLYDDPEQGIDIDYARQIIGDYIDDKKRFVLIQPKTMEQALGIAEAGVKSNYFKLIILDSIGSLVPKKVLDDELDDANVALVATRLTTWLQRNAFDVRYNQMAFVGLNQVRDKITKFASGFETPGGHYWKHVTSLRIDLGKLADIIKGEDHLGIQTKFVIRKSKISPPFRTFYFPIMFGKGIDKEVDLVEFAITMGVLIRNGPYINFNGEQIGNGFDKTVEILKKNKELLDKIEKACYNIVNKVKEEVDNGEITSSG